MLALPIDSLLPVSNQHDTVTVTVPMSGQLMVNDIGVIRAMVQSGECVALLPSYLCHSSYKDDQLVRVLPECHAQINQLKIAYPRQRFMPLKLKIFVEIATQELQKWLNQSVL